MPTPPLPLLHQILRVLHIPVFPPTLASISPSLLLIVLETLLGHPIALSKQLRLCETPEAEVCVVKCILGVLADDVLGMDLTLVDPQAVVDGGERELEVVIMAFAVIAKRRGLNLRLPKEEEVDLDLDWEGDECDERGLQDPIEPDVSFSSPVRAIRHEANDDVFTSAETKFPYRKASHGSSHRSSVHTTDTEGEEDQSMSKQKARTVLDEILEEFGT